MDDKDKKIFELDSQISDIEIFERDIAWLNESQFIVAEVSQPSLGVGFEIATALSKGKKVLCLYKNQINRELSAMISGNKNIHIINGAIHRDKIRIERAADFDLKMEEAKQKNQGKTSKKGVQECLPSSTRMSRLARNVSSPPMARPTMWITNFTAFATGSSSSLKIPLFRREP